MGNASRRQYSIGLSLALSAGLLFQSMGLAYSEPPALEETRTLPSAAELISADVQVQHYMTELDRLAAVTGGKKTVNMKLHGVPLPDALRALAQQAGFSVVVDESVGGIVNVDLQRVSVQEALESFKGYGNLAYAVEGKSLIVAKAGSVRANAFLRASTQIIPLKNANAKILSQILNQSLFGISGQAGAQNNSSRFISYDYHTNSLVVTGSPNDIEMVANHARELDFPRETRTWRLSHANAVDVATILSSSIFNEGMPGFTIGGSGSSSPASNGGVNLLPASMNVQQETIKEAAQTTAGSTNIESSSSSGTPLGDAITLRARVKQDQRASVSAQGPILIPDSRLNTITLMGTTEQIAMAEAIIPTLDRKVPQVILEASVIELTEKQLRVLGHHMGANLNGALVGSNNPGTSATPRSGNTGILTDTINQVVFGYTTNPIQRLRRDFQYQLDLLDRQDKLKLVANPTVITAHDNETVISVVDEIIRKNELTLNGVGALVGSEAEIGNVGVVLNILPKIGANGTVSLRVRPTVSNLSSRLTGAFNSQVNLISKRELLVQNVVLKDGDSFILGGLTSDADSDIKSKIPGVSDLPVVGQLSKNSNRNKKKSELIIIITPHIINDEADMASSQPVGAPGNAMGPVNLNDGNKKKSGNGAFAPVSYNGYQTRQSNDSYLPPLQVPQALDNRLPATPSSEVLPGRPMSVKPARDEKLSTRKNGPDTLMMLRELAPAKESNNDDLPLKPID